RITAVQRQAAGRCPVEAGDAVEHRRFAGAVRPDQCGDIAALDLEIEVIDGDDAAETHGQMLDPQHGEAVARRQPRPSVTRSTEMVLRVLRNADGTRVAIRPRGRQRMMAPIARPNSSMRYWVGSKVGPKICLRKSSCRMISVPPIMTTAAIATPIWLPMPPRTTIERIVADSRKVKDSGEIKPWRAAKNEPAKPANIAPMAKAVSLVLVVLMPSERQAISSSRKASHARPIGSRRSRTLKAAVIRARARIT